MAFQQKYCVNVIERLFSEVLATFADHFCVLFFLTSYQWSKETAVALFQEDVAIVLVT